MTISLVLMGYYNPILRYGLERFVYEARAVGADGLIVPDLPPEEGNELQNACAQNELDLIFLAAPTSTGERLQKISDATHGFLYFVSLTGVTGARETLPLELDEFVTRARAVTSKPHCIGFGISGAETARRVAKIAEGVIVGSALVARMGDEKTAVKSARAFVTELHKAIREATAVP